MVHELLDDGYLEVKMMKDKELIKITKIGREKIFLFTLALIMPKTRI